MSLELANPLRWNLNFRGSFEGKRGDVFGQYLKPDPIPPLTVFLKSPLLMIGIGCTASKPNWYRGAYAKLLLPISPSATTSFVPKVDSVSDAKICRLGYLSLIDFNSFGLEIYQLQLVFPSYFPDVYVEVWEYSENLQGKFKPAPTDKYTIANDLKAARARLETQTFDLEINESAT